MAILSIPCLLSSLFIALLVSRDAQIFSHGKAAHSENEHQPSASAPSEPPEGTPRSTSIAITRSTQTLPRNDALTGFIKNDDTADVRGHRVLTNVNLIGTSYIAHVTVGSQTIPLLVDTGSSDLWVVPSNFNCLDRDGLDIEQASCGFPTFYDGHLSGGVVTDEYFSIVYGNGQFIYGPYGQETVSLGGITVPHQQIAMPSGGYFQVSTGDFAGLLGLAYPAMVPARKGLVPKPAMNNTDPFAEHDTWFFNAVKKNLTLPLFSMALEIDGGGLLGIGQIVDVPISGDFVSSPILMVSFLTSPENRKADHGQMDLVNETRARTDFTYYTIIADDYIIDGKSFSVISKNEDILASAGFPAVIDSGWSTNVLPPSLVTSFYAAFDEPPQPIEIRTGTMFASPCNATVPTFGVKISTRTLEMTPESILVARMNTTVNGTLMCGLGIQPGVEFAGVLGDTFLSSVLAVFDVGASEMRFAQRAPRNTTGRSEPLGQDQAIARDEL